MNISDALSIVGAIGGLITILAGAYQAMANKDKTESEADAVSAAATKTIVDSAAESLKIVQESMAEMRRVQGEMRLEITELKATVKTNQMVLEQKSRMIESLESKIFELNKTIIQMQGKADRDGKRIAELMSQVEVLQNENLLLKTELHKTQTSK